MIAALAAALSFASCQKESGNANEEGDPVNIRIKLNNEIVNKTRAIDGIDGGYEQDRVTLTGTDPVYVYIFTGYGKLLVKDEGHTVAQLQAGVTYQNSTYTLLTTAAKQVVILANVSTDLAPTTNEISDYASLQAKIETLNAAATRYGSGTASVITVYGESGITWNGPDGNGVEQGAASLELNPLLARIDAIVSTEHAEGLLSAVPTVGTTGVLLKGVAVLYSGTGSHFAPAFEYTYADAGAGKALQSGLLADDYTLWNGVGHGDAAQFGTKGGQTILHGSWDKTNGVWGDGTPVANVVTTTHDVFSRSFYAFPPTAAKHPTTETASKFYGYSAHTILTVYGDYYDSKGNITTLFWPVHFNGTDADPLDQGQHYKVNIGLKADFTDGDGGGTDPEEEHPADVVVTVSKAKWKTTINITKDFN